MNEVEVGKILTVASGFDRFITVDRVTVTAWHLALSGVDYKEAESATVAHFVGPKARETFSVRHILEVVEDRARLSAVKIEEDVRSAKARGLIDKSWPDRDRLPDDIREALFTLRDLERRAAADRSELDHIDGSPIDPGSVGQVA